MAGIDFLDHLRAAAWPPAARNVSRENMLVGLGVKGLGVQGLSLGVCGFSLGV